MEKVTKGTLETLEQAALNAALKKDETVVAEQYSGTVIAEGKCYVSFEEMSGDGKELVSETEVLVGLSSLNEELVILNTPADTDETE